MKIGFPAGGWKLEVEGPAASGLTAAGCEIENDALLFFDAGGGRVWGSSIGSITDVSISTPQDSPETRERPTIPHGPHVVDISFSDGARVHLVCSGSTDLESLTAARRFRKVIQDARGQ